MGVGGGAGVETGVGAGVAVGFGDAVAVGLGEAVGFGVAVGRCLLGDFVGSGDGFTYVFVYSTLLSADAAIAPSNPLADVTLLV